MSSRLPLVALVVALGVAAYALLPSKPARVVGDRPSVGPQPAPAAPDAAARGDEAAMLAPSGTAVVRADRPPRSANGVILDHGAIRLVLDVADGRDLGSAVRFDIDAVGPRLEAYPLPTHQDDGAWRYDDLPVGRYRIRVVADGCQTEVAEAVVPRDAETTVRVVLSAGGAIAYRATLLSGAPPESVELALLDGRGVAVSSSVQLPGGMVHLGVDPSARPVAMPPQGRIVGLKPGAYRLRATAPSGESDERALDVRVGDPASAELTIRR